MPEFNMPFRGRMEEAEFGSLPQFVQGYIEAMFFTSEEELEAASFDDLAPETLRRIEADYEAFTLAARPYLGQAFEKGFGHDQAGRDFWFTRNGHGAGFWDRKELAVPVWGDGGPQWTEPSLGERLSALCGHGTDFPGVDAYRGDDGKVYLS